MPDLANWRKSSFSGGGDGAECIEVSADGEVVRLRESDTPEAVITTTPAKFRAFIMGVKAGEFDHFAS